MEKHACDSDVSSSFYPSLMYPHQSFYLKQVFLHNEHAQPYYCKDFCEVKFCYFRSLCAPKPSQHLHHPTETSQRKRLQLLWLHEVKDTTEQQRKKYIIHIRIIIIIIIQICALRRDWLKRWDNVWLWFLSLSFMLLPCVQDQISCREAIRDLRGLLSLPPLRLQSWVSASLSEILWFWKSACEKCKISPILNLTSGQHRESSLSLSPDGEWARLLSFHISQLLYLLLGGFCGLSWIWKRKVEENTFL